MSSDSAHFRLRLPARQKAQIEAIAKLRGGSINSVIVDLLDFALKQKIRPAEPDILEVQHPSGLVVLDPVSLKATIDAAVKRALDERSSSHGSAG